MIERKDIYKRSLAAYYADVVRLLDTCRYWQEVSECECHSTLPIGACLRCDMDEAVKILTQNIEAHHD